MTDAALTEAFQNCSLSRNRKAFRWRGNIASVLAALAWRMPAQAVLSLTILFGCALLWILATKPVGVPALGWFLGRHAAILGAAMILLALKPRNLDTSDDAPGAAVST